MNDNDPFALVASAEKAQAKPIAPSANNMELVMLRAFFDAWEALHAIKGDKRNPETRSKYEAAAQLLVDAADPIRALRNG